jgi:hypothetical protein
VLGETGDATDVRSDGVRRVVTQLKIGDQLLTQSGHGKTPFAKGDRNSPERANGRPQSKRLLWGSERLARGKEGTEEMSEQGKLLILKQEEIGQTAVRKRWTSAECGLPRSGLVQRILSAMHRVAMRSGDGKRKGRYARDSAGTSRAEDHAE